MCGKEVTRLRRAPLHRWEGGLFVLSLIAARALLAVSIVIRSGGLAY